MVNKMTIWTYLEPFLYTKEYLHLAEISKILKKPHSSVRKYLNFFEKEGILIKNIKGRLTLYKLNYDFDLIIDYLVLTEKEKLIKSCKKDLLLKELVSFLHNNLKESNLSLIFGSSVLGIKKANDIDLLIVGKINFEKDLKEFEKKFNIKIHLINIKNLSEIKETLKKEIVKKHLIVNGIEGIIKWLV